MQGMGVIGGGVQQTYSRDANVQGVKGGQPMAQLLNLQGTNELGPNVAVACAKGSDIPVVNE